MHAILQSVRAYCKPLSGTEILRLLFQTFKAFLQDVFVFAPLKKEYFHSRKLRKFNILQVCFRV
nr:MAG TPA: hypothetical protein [Caudoviricetes sp.]